MLQKKSALSQAWRIFWILFFLLAIIAAVVFGLGIVVYYYAIK